MNQEERHQELLSIVADLEASRGILAEICAEIRKISAKIVAGWKEEMSKTLRRSSLNIQHISARPLSRSLAIIKRGTMLERCEIMAKQAWPWISIT